MEVLSDIAHIINIFFAGFLFACIQLSRTSNITTGATVGIFLQKELIVSEFIPSACKFCRLFYNSLA